MKILRINCCGDCQYLDFVGWRGEWHCKKIGKPICRTVKLGEHISIPDWCPLEEESDENN